MHGARQQLARYGIDPEHGGLHPRREVGPDRADQRPGRSVQYQGFDPLSAGPGSARPAAAPPVAPAVSRQDAERYVSQRRDPLPEGVTPAAAVTAVEAVLEEAAGRRGDEGFRDLRNELVARGLQLLSPATPDTAHALELPGTRAYQIGEVFDVADAVTGRAGPAAAPAPTLFVVQQPRAVDLSVVPGQAPGTLMFPPGARFEVFDDVTFEAQRTIWLRHPAEPPAPPAAIAAAGDEPEPYESGESDEDADDASPAPVRPTRNPQYQPSALPVDIASEAEWRRANPWWVPGRSGPRTRDGEQYSPDEGQRDFLNDHSLQVLWVLADGDCTFTATTYTVPQAEIRRRMLGAAGQRGIFPPAGEEADRVGWLLAEAEREARARLSAEEVSEIVVNAARVWRVPPPAPEADGIGWLLSQSLERTRAALGDFGPEDPLTGPQLRFFLASMLERDRDWHADYFYRPEPGEEIPADAETRQGMAAAVRRLTEYGEPYSHLFPYLIADFLGLSLQVLHENGVPRSLRQGCEGAAETYSIVLVNQHFLATVKRPDAQGEPPGWARGRPGRPGTPPEGTAWPPDLNENRIRQLVQELAEPAEGSSRFPGPQQAAEYARARYRVDLDSGQLLMLERAVLLHQLTAGLPGGSHASFVRDLARRYITDGAADLRLGADEPMPLETRASLGGEEDGTQWNPALWLHNVRRGNLQPGPQVMWSLTRMGLVDAPPALPWQWGLPAVTGGRLPPGTSLPLDPERSSQLIGHLAAPQRDGAAWTGPAVIRYLEGQRLTLSHDQLRLLGDLVLTRRYLAAVPAGYQGGDRLERAVAYYLRHGTPFAPELGHWQADPAHQPARAVLDDIAGQAAAPRWQLVRPALSPTLTSTQITELEQALARPGPGGQPWLAATVADHALTAWGATLTSSQLRLLAAEVLARPWLHGIPADTEDQWEQRRQLHATAAHYILTGNLDDPPSLTWLPGDPRPAHPRPWLASIRAERTAPHPAIVPVLTRMGIGIPVLPGSSLARQPWQGPAVNQDTGLLELDGAEFPLPAGAAGVLAALVADARAGRTGLTPRQLADAAGVAEAWLPDPVAGLARALGELPGRPFRVIRPDRRYQLVPSDEAPPLPQWQGLAVDPVSRQLQHAAAVIDLPAEAAGVLAVLIADALAGGAGLTSEQLVGEVGPSVVGIRGAVVILARELGGLPGRPFRVIRPDRHYQLARSDEAPPLPQWQGLAADPVTRQLRHDGTELDLPPSGFGPLAALIADASADGTGLTVEQLIETEGDGTPGWVDPMWFTDAAAAARRAADLTRNIVANLGLLLRRLPGRPFRLIMQGLSYQLVLSAEAPLPRWQGLAVDPVTRLLQHDGAEAPLTAQTAGALAALIDDALAARTGLTPGELAAAARTDEADSPGTMEDLGLQLGSLTGRPFRLIMRGLVMRTSAVRSADASPQTALRYQLVLSDEAPPLPQWQGLTVDPVARRLQHDGAEAPVTAETAGALAALIDDALAARTGLTPGELAAAARTDEADIPGIVAGLGLQLGSLPGRPFRLIMRGLVEQTSAVRSADASRQAALRYQLVLSDEAPPLPQWQGLAVDPVTRLLQHDGAEFDLSADGAGVLAALIDDALAARTGLTLVELAGAARTDEAEIPRAVADLGWNLGQLTGRPFRLIMRGLVEQTSAVRSADASPQAALRYQLVLSDEAPPLPQWQGLAVDPVTGQMQLDGAEVPLPPDSAGVLAALIADARDGGGGLTPGQLADAAGVAEAGVTEAEIAETVADLVRSLDDLDEQMLGQQHRRVFRVISRVIRQEPRYQLVLRDAAAGPAGDEHAASARDVLHPAAASATHNPARRCRLARAGAAGRAGAAI